MTPKEKAIELVVKMHNKYLISYIEAQRCALIAVDEILSVIWWGLDDDVIYWGKVKQEIEKL